MRDMRDTSSVRAALTFLRHNFGIKYIYRQCTNVKSLEHYLDQWKHAKYKNYNICYLAFHGEPDVIELGGERVTLDELADMLGDSCRDKIIHFGTCETIKVERKKIDRFLRNTEALCVCGYKGEIDFLDGSVFDMLLIEMFQKYKDVGKLREYMNHYYRDMVRNLEFTLHYL